MDREIAELKERVKQLEAKAKPVAKATWQESVGAMKGCDLLDEAIRLGAQWREQANPVQMTSGVAAADHAW